MVLQRSNQLPKLPKGIVRPEIVAGVNALGRGQDRESLIQFITTISQTMGPETLAKFINPDEYIKRLAAAQGIDYLNLVKSVTDVQQETQEQQQMMMQQELTKQAGQFASSPMMDPSKNPNAQEMYDGIAGQANRRGAAAGSLVNRRLLAPLRKLCNHLLRNQCLRWRHRSLISMLLNPRLVPPSLVVHPTM